VKRVAVVVAVMSRSPRQDWRGFRVFAAGVVEWEGVDHLMAE